MVPQATVEPQDGDRENVDVLFIKDCNHPRCQRVPTNLGDLQEFVSVDRTRAVAISEWDHSRCNGPLMSVGKDGDR